jgi:hypothetical protein
MNVWIHAALTSVDVLHLISRFSLARAMGCGTRLCSDFFEVAGQAFRLEVYPAGFTADTRKWVTVCAGCWCTHVASTVLDMFTTYVV